MVGRRVLVKEGGHVHDLHPLEPLVPLQGPDLRPDPAHHEVLEDPRRRRSHRIQPQRKKEGQEEESIPDLSNLSPSRTLRPRSTAGSQHRAFPDRLIHRLLLVRLDSPMDLDVEQFFVATSRGGRNEGNGFVSRAGFLLPLSTARSE